MRALPVALLLLACGARTGLDEPPRPDAGRSDAGRPDAGRIDAGRFDGGMPCPACDDGLFCNGAEACAEDGTCLPGTPPSCDDGDPCTDDRCDAAADACVSLRDERDADGDGVSTCSGDCRDDDASVFPGAAELCDFVDQNCDGRADEGVLSACGDCRPGCRIEPLPPEGGSFDLDRSEGLEIGPDGALRLSTTRTETTSAWIANYLYATVTQIDTRTGAQLAEYDSALLDGTNGAGPPGEECEQDRRGGNCPSRTAVDLSGAVYVANRAFFAQGTVTKIAGFEEDCIDRNGNGRIDTSRDLDADGIIERSVPGEFLGQEDECILWTVDVGGTDGIPRAIAIDASGHVWVGLHNGREAWELDPGTGARLRTVRMPGGLVPFAPYGAAADGRGRVWFVAAATGRIVAVDAATGAIVEDEAAVARDGCSGSYGIAIDEEDRVWIAGFQCLYTYRYTPSGRSWRAFPLPEGGATRGIAADGRGRIYVSGSHTFLRVAPGGEIVLGDPISRLSILNAETGEVIRTLGTERAPLPGSGTTGVGLDSSGAIWLVNQLSSTATRIDPVTFAAREFPTGTAPYTYSDFTGYALRTFTAPNGYLRTVLRGCEVGPTEWERVDWDADVPAGTRIELRARTAARAEDLVTTPFVGPFTARPTDLTAPPGPIGGGRFLEVELQLFAAGGASPSVRELAIQLNCPI